MPSTEPFFRSLLGRARDLEDLKANAQKKRSPKK
jgi:hypothetical protein